MLKSGAQSRAATAFNAICAIYKAAIELMTAPQTDTARHWPDIARRWAQVGHPLRPASEDIAFANRIIKDWTAHNGQAAPLILGVTPELYHLQWTGSTRVLAVDHTQAMIEHVWPGPQADAMQGDWTRIPLEAGSRNIVLCDGGLHLLPYPQGQQALVRELHRILRPGGIFILRLFMPPAVPESPDAVLVDLLAGKIDNLNLLKLRLGMALQSNAVEGVQLRDVWQRLHQSAPDFPTLARRIGWDLEHLSAIDTYRDSLLAYHFLTLETVRDLFCNTPGGFTMGETLVPGYTLGERCPTLVLHRA